MTNPRKPQRLQFAEEHLHDNSVVYGVVALGRSLLHINPWYVWDNPFQLLVDRRFQSLQAIFQFATDNK